MLAALTIGEFQKRPARRPAVHEEPPRYEIRQDGCAVARSCLHCPLPGCRYDDPFAVIRAQVRERIAKIQQLRDQGYETEVIARHLGISVRTVYRDTDLINSGALT